LFGALCLFLVDLKVSGASPEALVGTDNQPVIAARIWLFVIAIIAHNIPEGMAIGVSAGGGMADADSLAMGIALQDVPEGLVIALVLAGHAAFQSLPDRRCVRAGRAGGRSDLCLAGECCRTAAAAGPGLCGGGDAAGGHPGNHPESRSNGHHRLASLGLCIGFCLMMVMDTAMS
jgi:ZIP family zinc transporter